jgi:hypothetical protein
LADRITTLPLGRPSDRELEGRGEHIKMAAVPFSQLNAEAHATCFLTQAAIRGDEAQPVRASLVTDRLEVRRTGRATTRAPTDDLLGGDCKIRTS